MDLVESYLSAADVSARKTKVAHTLQSQLSQVSILDTRRDEGHRDVSESPVQ